MNKDRRKLKEIEEIDGLKKDYQEKQKKRKKQRKRKTKTKTKQHG